MPDIQRPRLYDEPFRPQYHFTPPAGFMNDPAGLVYLNGWHLYYQYDPFSMTAGSPSWGHALSEDLLHWRHLPVAIPKGPDGQIFTGSAIVDSHNSSGLFTSNGLVAVYTLSKPDKEVQNIAYSNNGGVTFAQYPGNPVLEVNHRNCRDPKVIWHSASRRWLMAIALPQGRQVLFYASVDLKKWDYLSSFGPVGIEACEWECPNLLEVPLEGSDQKKWVLLLGINPGAPLGGSINVYYVGDFDGTTFQAEHADTRLMDFGKDHYALQTFNMAPENEAIAIGWASNWQYTQNVPTFPWRGSFSIPRILRLRTDGIHGKKLLVQLPVSLESLRDKTLYEGTAVIGNNPLFVPLDGNGSFEFKATLHLRSPREGTRARAVIDILNQAGEKLAIGYDWSNEQLLVSRDATFGFSHPAFSGRFETVCPGAGEILKLHVLVDRSMVEVFVNDGLQVCTCVFFMQHGLPTGMAWYAEDGVVEVAGLNAYTLKSVWG